MWWCQNMILARIINPYIVCVNCSFTMVYIAWQHEISDHRLIAPKWFRSNLPHQSQVKIWPTLPPQRLCKILYCNIEIIADKNIMHFNNIRDQNATWWVVKWNSRMVLVAEMSTGSVACVQWSYLYKPWRQPKLYHT